MVLRICAAPVAAILMLADPAQAQSRPPVKLPDARAEFVRQCARHMLGRWAHPEEVCGCLHDHAVAIVEDNDLREALLRGIGETGVPTIETQWVPASKQSQIDPTFTEIAKPALQCMFDPARPNVRDYFFFGPNRGTHLRAATIPVAVILAPETCLTWPAGQLPSSTRMR